MKQADRKGYPTDVTDEEWEFVLPYLLLSREDSGSRQHSLRELFNGVRYIVRTGNQWRFMPNDPIPRPIFYNHESKGFEVETWFQPEMALWESKAGPVAA